MKKILIPVVIVMAAAAALAMRGTQDQTGTTPKVHEQHDKSTYPVAEYEADEPADLKVRALRKARGKRYNLRLRHSDNVDIRQLMLTEQSNSSWGGPPSHAPAEPALPVTESAAIVVGEVTDARAYLSDDKTYVYSEFAVRVDEVLKNTSAEALALGTSITTMRGGGAVRLPSGKVIQRGSGGKPFPRVQRKYLFFLKYETEGQDFPIITAYELRDGRIFPLDGLDIDGRLLEPYVAYHELKGANERDFLNKVREAIGKASTGSMER